MFDEEIERAVLYYMIFEHENFAIDENDFVNIDNKKIIRAINILKANNEKISILSVKSQIKPDDKTMLEYISSFGDYIYGTTAEVAYNKLIEYSKKRKIYKLAVDIKKGLEERKIAEQRMDIFIEKIIKELNDIQRRNYLIKTFTEMVISTMGEIEDNYNNRSDCSLYTGLVDLDKITLGLHKKELTVIGARPGIGKTTLALQIAEHIGEKGLHVGFVSLEMSDTQLIQKLFSKLSKVDNYKLRAGTLEENDFTKIAEVSGGISELPFHIISNVKTIQDIEVKARQLKNKEKLDLLIIDYLQLIKSSSKFFNREQEVAEISRNLKLLSLDLNIPVIALCQLNRNATRNEPSLSDLRESGSIEQDADNVFFLYHEEGQEEAIQPIILCKIAKQRNGEIGKIKLRFNKKNSNFLCVI